jgi:prevent-host-death family protein
MRIVVLEFAVKKITIDFLNTKCLAVLDEVQTKREPVLITKDGKPVATLVPANAEADDIYNFLAGKDAITGNVAAPAVSLEEWGELE